MTNSIDKAKSIAMDITHNIRKFGRKKVNKIKKGFENYTTRLEKFSENESIKANERSGQPRKLIGGVGPFKDPKVSKGGKL